MRCVLYKRKRLIYVRKILTFTDAVPLQTYIYHGAVLGIMFTQFEKYAPWFYSHFIQMFTGKRCGPFGFFDMNFNDYPFLDCQNLRNTMLFHMKIDFQEFVQRNLDQGWYVYVNLDESYLSCKKAYRRDSFIHTNIIFGYDQEKQIYHIAGYMKSQNKYSRFMIAEVGMDEIEKAFLATNHTEQELILMKLNDFKPKMDLNLLIESLYDYTYSQNTSSRVRAKEEFSILKRTYGLDTIERLLTRMQKIIDEGYGKTYELDLRIFRALCEHKKCMYNRLIYLNNENIVALNESFISEYEAIVKEYDIIFFEAKKVILTQNTNTIRKMIPRLSQLKDKEKNILSKVLNVMIDSCSMKEKVNLKIY